MLLLLKQLFWSINRKRQINAILLIFTMALSSITELLSIALFVPFISLILGNKDFQNGKIFLLINQYTDTQTITLFTILIFILSGALRVFTLFWQNMLAANANNEIVYKAYDAILNEDYDNHIKKSKSNLIAVIHSYGDRLLTEVILPVLLLIESIIFISLICFSLFLYNWKIFITIFFLFLVIYIFVFKRSNKLLKSSSLKQVRLNEKLLERLDVELNSIEYIHLGNYQSICSSNYGKYDREYKINLANYLITSRLPRIIVEYLILVLILLLILFLYLSNNISNTLPLLAAGGLLTQKSLPYLQKIYENWASLSQYKYAALSILNYSRKFNKKNIKYSVNHKNIDFSEIKFKNVDFSYENKSKILNNINFSIIKGEKIAIMGPSGTGKTTLLRLICGLLIPTSGKVLINGKEINKRNNYFHTIKWMRSIGYVPQKINLTGRTLRENIVFNNKSIKKPKIKIEEIIKITLLEDLVKRCNGLDNDIFQSTFSLSGGENQRLAIARAIYQNSKLLIMDEPTSSLDVSTQEKLFENLNKLSGITYIVITHRVETKYLFDKILEIKDKDLFENK